MSESLRSRVLFVIPSLRRAGAEAQAVSLINGLPAADFEKHLVYYLADSELEDAVDRAEVTIHRLSKDSRLDFKLARQLARIIDEHDIDVVHCTLQNALVYAWAARLLAKRKPQLICALHTTTNVDFKNDAADFLLHKSLLKRCAQVWFVCHTQAKVWFGRMPFLQQRHRVLYNGIDTDYFALSAVSAAVDEFRHALQLADDALIVSCIAGFRPEKGHLLLLQAFARVAPKHRNAVLVLAGRGGQEQLIRHRVDELGLTDKVIFAGELGDVRPLLAISSCKVIASTAVETFSIAMLEAMAMQVPVISSRIGGAAEAIEDHRNGILIEQGDVDALADALELLLGDAATKEQYGINARQKVVSMFTDAQMAELGSQYLQQLRQG